MIYWRIQMNQPDGRGGNKIKSLDLLNENKPIIGTGEWDDIQCKYFKGEHNNGFAINDIILVHEGKTPIALCKVLSESFTNDELKTKYQHDNFRYVQVLDIYKENKEFPAAQGTIERLINDTKSRRFISDYYDLIMKNMEIKNILKVLEHKKQIILQGPPGTGKTRLAKQIAEKLTNPNLIKFRFPFLSDNYIKTILTKAYEIPSSTGRTTYRILEINDSKCTIELDSKSTYEIDFKGIVKAYKSELWISGQKNGFDPCYAAIAKYIFENKELAVYTKNENDYTLIQFHPSYTYEDFVRGISVKSNDSNVEYITENKTLASIANEALENYNDSQKAISVISKEKWLKEQFEDFKDHIIDSMADGKFVLNETCNIISIEIDAFRYTGNTWKNQFRMKYADLLFLFENNIHERVLIKKEEKINPLARTHATYFKLVLDQFTTFMKGKQPPFGEKVKIDEKKYVLIIDEINRANLSSVLGELIYALEYRGEPVNSMYDIDGDKKIILPSNLYIIGTMNTADRSVGQIDYAIRRRFAFVDVLPKILSETDLNADRNGKQPKLYFKKDIFLKVQELFLKDKDQNSEHLSEEFEAKDVQLGHSYFIYEEGKFDLKLKYEIKPILNEYVTDGILKTSAIDLIKELAE